MLDIAQLYTSVSGEIVRSPYATRVFADLVEIVQGDGGLGWIPSDDSRISSIYLVPVTYSPKKSGYPQTRINQIVNEITGELHILGLGPLDSIPYGHDRGKPMTSVVGSNYGSVDSEGHYSGWVFYDVTQCNNSGLWVRNDDNKKIALPNDVLLFHELSEAYSGALRVSGDLHRLGLQDENEYRRFLGLPLRNTGAFYDVGCGPTDTGPKPKSCFITTTVAYGTPPPPRLQQFRDWREHIINTNRIAAEIYANADAEYYQFSTFVALEMQKSPQLKKLVRNLFFEPLLNFFNLSMIYIEKGWKQKEPYNETVELTLTKFIINLNTKGYTKEDILSMHEDIVKGISIMRRNVQTETPNEYRADKISSYSSCQSIFRLIQEHIPRLIHLDWAFLSPLEIFWSSVFQTLQQGSSNRGIGNCFSKNVLEWLEKTPIPSSISSRDENSLREDLEYLAINIFINPLLRQKIGEQIIYRCEKIHKHKLMKILEETGYLEPSRSEKEK